jgi:hypothetical protein
MNMATEYGRMAFTILLSESCVNYLLDCAIGGNPVDGESRRMAAALHPHLLASVLRGDGDRSRARKKSLAPMRRELRERRVADAAAFL